MVLAFIHGSTAITRFHAMTIVVISLTGVMNMAKPELNRVSPELQMQGFPEGFII